MPPWFGSLVAALSILVGAGCLNPSGSNPISSGRLRKSHNSGITKKRLNIPRYWNAVRHPELLAITENNMMLMAPVTGRMVELMATTMFRFWRKKLTAIVRGTIPISIGLLIALPMT